MIRTTFIPRNELAKMIQALSVNKTKTVTRTFTEKETVYIFKYLRRTDVWTRVSKTTYTNSNHSLVIKFNNNHNITVKGA